VGVNDRHVLFGKVEQGFGTNKERLLINNFREAVRFRARMRLVVATRLQTQHSSFQLHSSSNTASVLTNNAQGPFANSDEEMHSPYYNFCLKKHLDKPAQFKTRFQFGRAHQPVRTHPWLSFTHKGLGS
jgi:hypothetical protein